MQSIHLLSEQPDWLKLFTSSGSSFALVFAAELGDKSQLVCMALAARYRAAPVIVAATLAFLFLNALAVIFGATIANWLPAPVMSAVVAMLFMGFGIVALRNGDTEQVGKVSVSHHNILVATFLLITLAELGDKTQLAVIAMSATQNTLAVMLGASLALISTTLLGVWAGRKLLQKISMQLVHRISGVIFILMALLAGYNALTV